MANLKLHQYTNSELKADTNNEKLVENTHTLEEITAICENYIKCNNYLTLAQMENIFRKFKHEPHTTDVEPIRTKCKNLNIWVNCNDDFINVIEKLAEKFTIKLVKNRVYLLDGIYYFALNTDKYENQTEESWLPIAFTNENNGCKLKRIGDRQFDIENSEKLSYFNCDKILKQNHVFLY